MKVYYNQEKIASSFRNFFNKFFISKPQLKSISYILTGMISAESIVTSDISRKLKDDFSLINLESIERRFRRFFRSFSAIAYSFYSTFICYIISKFSVKHSDNKIHISFDHMFYRDHFTIIVFSLRIGKQGIPIWFRCFKGYSPNEAFSMELIKEGISYCSNIFAKYNYHIIFLADRWFAIPTLLSFIESLNCFYCIRCRADLNYSYYNSKGFLRTAHIGDIKSLKYRGKVLKNVFFTQYLFPTNIVVSNSSNTDEVWYILTNDDTSRAIRNYSYRFGSIECIFKSQKTNGFRLESTRTKKIEHFISLFTLVCVALTWLTIIGADYVRNKHTYYLKIRDIHKRKDKSYYRYLSLFNLGLTIFNLCYYNTVNFTLKFTFVLYDV